MYEYFVIVSMNTSWKRWGERDESDFEFWIV